MKRKYYALALFLLLIGGAGLPQGREIEELHLVTALAVDLEEQGVAVTALTGVRASEDKAPLVLTGAGGDLEEACQAVQQVRASHAYLGQADKLLLGEALARQELMETLDFVLDHRELRLDTLLYIVKSSAGEGLAATAPDAAGETPGRDQRGVTVGQVLARLYQGESARVPALAPDGQGKLAPAGWAALESWGLAGYDGEMVTAAVEERAWVHG